MAKRSTHPRLPPQILDAAATWFVEFSEGELNLEARAEFIRWLRTSPEHLRAYLQIAAFWEEAPLLEKSRTLSADELIALARSNMNVAPLLHAAAPLETSMLAAPESAAAPTEHQIFLHRPAGVSARVLLAASLCVMVAGLGAWVLMQRNTYTTGIGEQRSIALADGSTVELNSRSRVRIRFGERERDIDLIEGQALFRVAKDHVRPFVVRSGEMRVRAVGTQFDMYRRKSGTTVTVIEGRVAVTPSGIAGTAPHLPASAEKAPLKPLLVAAGEQMIVSATAGRQPIPADIPLAIAWTQHKIVFRDTPLAEAVEEFNRYNVRQMTLTDPSVASVRINGVFSSTAPTALLQFLQQLPAFSVHEEDGEIRIGAR